MKLLLCTVCASLLAAVPPTVAQTTVPLTDRSLVKLLPDPVRPKVYGLNQGNGTLPGTLLAFNSTNGQPSGEIPVGLNPTDMAMPGTGEALYVINTGSRTMMKVDLMTFAVTATRSFSTPNTYDPANPLHVAAGRSNVVYFTDGGWSPGVYTFNFATGAVLGEFDDDNGVGGLAVTRDGATMYTWRQYGWSAGNVNSWVSRLDARNANLLPLETSFASWRRDPFDTPILLNASETLVFNKQQMFAATNVANSLKTSMPSAGAGIWFLAIARFTTRRLDICSPICPSFRPFKRFPPTTRTSTSTAAIRANSSSSPWLCWSAPGGIPINLRSRGMCGRRPMPRP